MCVPDAKDVISDMKELFGSSGLRNPWQILKTHDFRSYVGGQGFFIGLLVIVQFGMGQSVRKRPGYLYQTSLSLLGLSWVYTLRRAEPVFIMLELWGCLFPEWDVHSSPIALFSQSILLPAAPQVIQITGVNFQPKYRRWGSWICTVWRG